MTQNLPRLFSRPFGVIMVCDRMSVKRRSFDGLYAMSMTRKNDGAVDVARRDFIAQALSLGIAAGSAGWSLRVLAATSGGRSVYRMQGDVWVNGRPIGANATLRPSDSIKTGSNSYLITRVGDHAFLIRENSVLEMAGDDALRSLRLVSGKMLGLFASQGGGEPIKLRTVTATIGIRGTTMYAEAHPDRTYFCTCYGATTVASVTDPLATENITSKHHDAPRWIVAASEKGQYILPALVINHTDDEIAVLETLLGRKGSYQTPTERPRREY